MKLETERLELIPLNEEQLAMLLWDLGQLEQVLECSYEGNEIAGPVALAVEEQYNAIKMCDGKEDYLFFTFWQILLKRSRKIVGSICIKGKPDNQGSVEIGYGLSSSHEKKGYMTESVNLLIKWLLEQPEVKTVTAETSKHNEASQWVLKRCGMSVAKSLEEMQVWSVSK